MKKAVITSGLFTGTVVAIYGEAGVGEQAQPPLLYVDFNESEADDKAKKYLMKNIPIRYGGGYEQQFGDYSAHFTVIVQEEELDFKRDFWNVYGKKVNPDRCMKEWGKMKPNERVLAVGMLPRYLRHLARLGWKPKADPESYLKKKYWNTNWDEIHE